MKRALCILVALLIVLPAIASAQAEKAPFNPDLLDPERYYRKPIKQVPLRPDSVAKSGLTVKQAEQVLIIVLKHEKYNISLMGTFIEDHSDEGRYPPFVPGYYDFGVGRDTPEAGATDPFGFYVVSVLTGDVWEINACKHYNFPELRRVQKAIMKRTGKTFADEKAARRGTGCTR